ncbi:MAG: hypothetical protein MdMp014T_2105 [Treponematales bacterium]
MMGGATVAVTAVTSAVDMYQKNKAIDANEGMTDREKSKAKGGNTGEVIGKTVGAAGGVALALAMGAKGAAIGAGTGALAGGVGAIPGAVIGAAAGIAGGIALGYAGKKVGELAGDYAGFKKEREAMLNEEPQTTGLPKAVSAGVAAPETEGPEHRTLVSNDGWNFTEVPPPRKAVPQTPGIPQAAPLGVEAPQSVAPSEPVAAPPSAVRQRRGRNRFIGHYIDSVPERVREEVRSVAAPAAAVPPVEVGGEIQLHSTLEVRGDVMCLRHKMGRNTTPYKYQTGQTLEALEYA